MSDNEFSEELDIPECVDNEQKSDDSQKPPLDETLDDLSVLSNHTRGSRSVQIQESVPLDDLLD